MSVIRVNKTKDYTIMSNHHLKEKMMSLKAKGLLSEMLSLPENWDYSIAGLVAINKENETAIKSTLNELKQFGYLKVTKVMPNDTKTGRIEYVYDIFEKPKQGSEKQGVDFLGVEFLGLENQGQYNINNKNTNNKILNNIKESKKKNFVKPSIEEIQEYCNERNNGINANAFYDFYESKGWCVGKNKMKDWKACIRTWEQRNIKVNNNPSWFKKETQKERLTKEELEEMENLMKKFS